MSTNYPGAIDNFTNPTSSDYEDILSHAGQHSNANDAITAIEQVVGTTNGSGFFNAFTANQKPVPQEGGTIGPYTYQGGTFSGGLFNSVTLGTPTIGHITSPGTSTPTVFDRGLAPTVVTLTDAPSGTIVPVSSLGQVFSLDIGTTAGNRTIGTPLNPTPGQAISFRVKQNAGNTGTIVFSSVFRMSTDIGTLSLGTASTVNYFGFRYHEDDLKWDFQGQSRNLI